MNKLMIGMLGLALVYGCDKGGPEASSESEIKTFQDAFDVVFGVKFDRTKVEEHKKKWCVDEDHSRRLICYEQPLSPSVCPPFVSCDITCFGNDLLRASSMVKFKTRDEAWGCFKGISDRLQKEKRRLSFVSESGSLQELDEKYVDKLWGLDGATNGVCCVRLVLGKISWWISSSEDKPYVVQLYVYDDRAKEHGYKCMVKKLCELGGRYDAELMNEKGLTDEIAKTKIELDKSQFADANVASIAEKIVSVSSVATLSCEGTIQWRLDHKKVSREYVQWVYFQIVAELRKTGLFVQPQYKDDSHLEATIRELEIDTLGFEKNKCFGCVQDRDVEMRLRCSLGSPEKYEYHLIELKYKKIM